MDVIGGAGGVAGWVGAGLLGMVLYWLLTIHLPAKDKQIKDFADAKDQQVQAIAEVTRHDFTAALAQTRQDFRDNLERVLVFHERQVSAMTSMVHKDMEQLAGMVGLLRNAVEAMSAQFERRHRDEGHPVERRNLDV